MADRSSTANKTYAWVSARRHVRGERGASAVEYGLMITLIAAAIFASVVFLGQGTRESLDCTATAVRSRGAVC